MPFLSPAKLFVILVVALVVLGPDKLPKMAKQLGALWGDLRALRAKLESEVRGTFPDVPSTDTITQAVRSPLAFLDHLADSHREGSEASIGPDRAESWSNTRTDIHPSEPGHLATTVVGPQPTPPPVFETPVADSEVVVHHQAGAGDGVVTDDPGMN
ncbi:MAG: twin-arginine translocase TatA/TatE family subunit [Acidimicrobiales bacterium]